MVDAVFRSYDRGRDKEAAQRIWREVSWLHKGDEAAMDIFVQSGRAMVAEVDGAAECVVLSAPGTMQYLDQVLPFAGITSVTTSRIARKQGLASRLAARTIAADAAEGAAVVGLGMFEQGFYNQLGFGTGGYELWTGFDPARLTVRSRARMPRRITADDWALVHASRLARRRVHGSITFTPPGVIQAEMRWSGSVFGLGYRDGPEGELTHHLWLKNRGGEHGPYAVEWMSFRTWEQFMELMALLKSLGDQVRLVRMREPPGIQLQDLVEEPFKQHHVREKGRFEVGTTADAYWQMRICNLAACLGHTRLSGGSVRFNLSLSDPLERYLDAGAPWRGVGGDYVVTLGAASGAELGVDPALPTLTATVNAFTRMWLGVLPASSLSATDDLDGPRELLRGLDSVLCIPQPKPDWDF